MVVIATCMLDPTILWHRGFPAPPVFAPALYPPGGWEPASFADRLATAHHDAELAHYLLVSPLLCPLLQRRLWTGH